ncbi:hypothetical protein [Euzebya sp.]|uniref:hypothetical protein n=1 Tax=Euzebya sp. TaxID=1971409 RepID=UPI0035154FC0
MTAADPSPSPCPTDSPRPARAADDGSAVVWLLVVPLLVLVLAAISLDLWGALSARGRIAAIADEAAAAGATALSPEASRAARQQVALDPDEATRRALEAVDTHPEVARVIQRSAAATPDVVRVTVEGRYDLLLLRLVGQDAVAVTVTGHATPRVEG